MFAFFLLLAVLVSSFFRTVSGETSELPSLAVDFRALDRRVGVSTYPGCSVFLKDNQSSNQETSKAQSASDQLVPTQWYKGFILRSFSQLGTRQCHDDFGLFSLSLNMKGS